MGAMVGSGSGLKGRAGRVNLEIFLKLYSKSLDLGFFFRRQIRTRLKGATQASGRKVRPMTTL